MVEFSDLPDDIVDDVFRRLSDVEDCVRFPSVCKLWSSVASTDYDKERPRKPLSPWLMLATLQNDSQDGEEGGVRICYSFLGNNKLFRLPLPELQGRKGWGTLHGWLLTLGLDVELYLFHPFTRAKISLPSPHKFSEVDCQYENSHHLCESFIRRVAISSNPSKSHPVAVMVVYGGSSQISFASPGDDYWTHIKFAGAGPMEDVIFFNGSFYCLSGDGVVYVCDITDPLQPTTRLIALPPKDLRRHTDYYSDYYLVGIDVHLYIIQRKCRACEESGLDPEDISTLRSEAVYFCAYEFDLHAKNWTDGEAKDFNGHAILVGNNTSCAISTIDHPELKPDCIYFTDDGVENYRNKLGCYNDMGVYDFKNKVMMEPFYTITESQWCSKFSRPFFFLPTLK